MFIVFSNDTCHSGNLPSLGKINHIFEILDRFPNVSKSLYLEACGGRRVNEFFSSAGGELNYLSYIHEKRNFDELGLYILMKKSIEQVSIDKKMNSIYVQSVAIPNCDIGINSATTQTSHNFIDLSQLPASSRLAHSSRRESSNNSNATPSSSIQNTRDFKISSLENADIENSYNLPELTTSSFSKEHTTPVNDEVSNKKINAQQTTNTTNINPEPITSISATVSASDSVSTTNELFHPSIQSNILTNPRRRTQQLAPPPANPPTISNGNNSVRRVSLNHPDSNGPITPSLASLLSRTAIPAAAGRRRFSAASADMATLLHNKSFASTPSITEKKNRNSALVNNSGVSSGASSTVNQVANQVANQTLETSSVPNESSERNFSLDGALPPPSRVVSPSPVKCSAPPSPANCAAALLAVPSTPSLSPLQLEASTPLTCQREPGDARPHQKLLRRSARAERRMVRRETTPQVEPVFLPLSSSNTSNSSLEEEVIEDVPVRSANAPAISHSILSTKTDWSLFAKAAADAFLDQEDEKMIFDAEEPVQEVHICETQEEANKQDSSNNIQQGSSDEKPLIAEQETIIKEVKAVVATASPLRTATSESLEKEPQPQQKLTSPQKDSIKSPNHPISASSAAAISFLFQLNKPSIFEQEESTDESQDGNNSSFNNLKPNRGVPVIASSSTLGVIGMSPAIKINNIATNPSTPLSKKPHLISSATTPTLTSNTIQNSQLVRPLQNDTKTPKKKSLQRLSSSSKISDMLVTTPKKRGRPSKSPELKAATNKLRKESSLVAMDKEKKLKNSSSEGGQSKRLKTIVFL